MFDQKHLREDCLDLTLFFLVTLAVWYGGYHLRPGFAISSGDGTFYYLPYLFRLFHHDLPWYELSYDSALLGGIKLHAARLVPWTCDIIHSLGGSAVTALNAPIFLFQLGYGFLGLRLSSSIAELLLELPKGKRIQISWWQKVFYFLLHAFFPALVLSFTNGRFLTPFLFICTSWALFFQINRNTLSAVAAVFYFFLLCDSLAITFFPFFAYSISFGGILSFGLFSLVWQQDTNKSYVFKCLLKTFLIGLLALLCSFPKMVDAIQHFLSSDASRSLESGALVYQHFVGKWEDWLHSIPWTLGSLQTSGNSEFLHERNFPMGPLILSVIFCFFHKKTRILALSVVVATFLAYAYSTNLHPISDLELKFIPGLAAFRVPMRSVIPIMLLLPPLTSGLLIFISQLIPVPERRNKYLTWFGLACFSIFLLAMYVVYPVVSEILLWTGMAVFFVFAICKKSPNPIVHNFISYLCLSLAFFSVFTFKERLLSFTDLRQIGQNRFALREKILLHYPDLAFPLNRAQLAFTDEKFLNNTASVLERLLATKSSLYGAILCSSKKTFSSACNKFARKGRGSTGFLFLRSVQQ